MKLLLLLPFLFFIGCIAEAKSKPFDAGLENKKSQIYIDGQIKYMHAKYFRICVRQCYKDTYSDECIDKCQKDFKQIAKVLTRAINENKEDDFDAIMNEWYQE